MNAAQVVVIAKALRRAWHEWSKRGGIAEWWIRWRNRSRPADVAGVRDDRPAGPVDGGQGASGRDHSGGAE